LRKVLKIRLIATFAAVVATGIWVFWSIVTGHSGRS
jgi:hypothetical protein